jgi:hypothetical protein
MLRKLTLTLALAASAALGAAALSPTTASAHGWHGGHWGHGWGHSYGAGFGFSPVYVGPQYADDGCYVTRRVRTARGIRLRTINVCY